MRSSFLAIFVIAFFLNLLYEMIHSLLYATCLQAKLPQYVYLILKAALFDGCAITLIYYATFLMFHAKNPFSSMLQIFTFIVISLGFAWAWEMHAITRHRWEYSSHMPRVLGVGITPLVQLAATGLSTLYIVSVIH